MLFLCEGHVGAKIEAVLQNAPNCNVTSLKGQPDSGDRAIVETANSNDQTIVTRDNDFPNRRICSIDYGVLYIPQRLPSGTTLRLEEVLDCLRRLARSGRLEQLGHGVCTVNPESIMFKTLSGEEVIQRQEI